MPLMNFGKCWRGRDDYESFTAIEGLPPDVTEEQLDTLDFEPVDFICCGCIAPEARGLPQDAYRFCFKNAETDEISDNDEQDLTHMLAVISHSLAIISTRRVNGGMTEVPTRQGEMAADRETLPPSNTL